MSSPHGVSIDVEGLHKAFDGTPVLQGIDLHVGAGEIVVIIGGSGEGKSVLLRHLAGLERPDAGAIRLNDLPLDAYLQLPPEEKPFRVSMVFQSSALLNSLSVADNVSLRLKEHRTHPGKEIDQIVATCLEQVDMAGTEDRMPSELSGGMRKRVAIARALAVAPQLILYDEPTADLDPILTVGIGDLIERIRDRRGATQVIVAHNLALAGKIGDHVAVLHDGRIIDYQPARQLAHSAHPHTQQLLRAANLKVSP